MAAENDELLFNDDNGPVGSSEKLYSWKEEEKFYFQHIQTHIHTHTHRTYIGTAFECFYCERRKSFNINAYTRVFVWVSIFVVTKRAAREYLYKKGHSTGEELKSLVGYIKTPNNSMAETVATRTKKNNGRKCWSIKFKK